MDLYIISKSLTKPSRCIFQARHQMFKNVKQKLKTNKQGLSEIIKQNSLIAINDGRAFVQASIATRFSGSESPEMKKTIRKQFK